MSLQSRPLVLAAVATVLVALAPVLDEPAFRPAAGSSLTKTFVYGLDMSLDEFSLIVDGQDFADALGSFEVTLEVENTITVTDTYVTTEGGRPVKLKREFDTIEGVTGVGMTTDFGGEDQELPSSSELEGATVVFQWDEEEEAYDVSFEDGEGEADLLEGLVEDMDLRAFLPTGEVSVDDTWKVDLKELGRVALPGGDLALLPDELDEESFGDTDVFEGILDEEYGEYLSELLEGTCVCTYKGKTEEGLGEIHIAIEIGSAADLTDMLTHLLETIGESVGEAPPLTIELADLNLDFEGEGVLLWNLEAGRMASFELMADVIVAADIGITGEVGGQSQSAELSAEMSGSYTFEVETEE